MIANRTAAVNSGRPTEIVAGVANGGHIFTVDTGVDETDDPTTTSLREAITAGNGAGGLAVVVVDSPTTVVLTLAASM